MNGNGGNGGEGGTVVKNGGGGQVQLQRQVVAAPQQNTQQQNNQQKDGNLQQGIVSMDDGEFAFIIGGEEVVDSPRDSISIGIRHFIALARIDHGNCIMNDMLFYIHICSCHC